MPFVVVEMWKGRTVEQKRNLVKAITDAMIEHADEFNRLVVDFINNN